MARFAFLLPREEMSKQVRTVMDKYGFRDAEIKTIATSDTIEEAYASVRDGADILIARGYQANLIRMETDYIVIDISMTGQEMGVMITQAKRRLGLEKPYIAVVGMENMFCDMQFFEELYGIKLRTFYVETLEEIRTAVIEARDSGADLLLGGDFVNKYASEMGVPHMFTGIMGEEAITIAFRTAQSVGYALDLEKRNTAQLETLLDYSFNGIIKLDRGGHIEAMNTLATDMLNIESAAAIGQHITHLVKQIDIEMLDSVLVNGEEKYASFMRIHNSVFAVSLAPVKLDSYIDGAVVSFNEVQKVVNLEAKIRREIYPNRLIAGYHFEDLAEKSVGIRKELERAKLYAMTSAPILITGCLCGESEYIAQCIHNEGALKNGPYVYVKCSSITAETQFSHLFGSADQDSKSLEKGAVGLAHMGTLVLDDIESLSMQCQSNLLSVMSSKMVTQKSAGAAIPVNVRIIAITNSSIAPLVKDGLFNAELFFALNTLSLEIPPLERRRDDITEWVDHYVKTYCQKYSKHISITKDAKNVLSHFDWDGNLMQISSFCERMVIMAPYRTVNEAFVEKLLLEAYPILRNRMSDNKIETFKSREAAQIAALLEQFGGNRTEVAGKIGISTTTLWRKMKKYGITHRYEA